MYRIRRLSGGEVNLASIDELAAAIAAGTVTADAEIYHQRGERWLPIASHPHFRIAKDRSESPVRNPTPAPVAAAPAAPPTLRLVRSDMNGTAPASEPRPVSRWTPPQRPLIPVPRPSGNAAPATEPVNHVVEFVAEQPPAPPVPAEPPVRPKRVEPAVAGLPLLDVEMREPPRTTRQSAPMPPPAKSALPLALPEPGPTPIGARLATPMPSPAMPPTLQSVRTAPRVEHAPLPTPVMPVAPVASTVTEVVREPVAVTAPAVMYASGPVPLPWQPQAEQDPLDVPPPVRDFSVASDDVVEQVSQPEPMFTDVVEAPAPSRARQRWPMIAGAVVVMALAAFLALRPRSEVDSLDPKPGAAQPSPTLASPSDASAEATLSATPAGARPQVTPVVPAGPSLDPTADAEASETKDVVVPAAPRLRGAVPESALKNVGSIKVDVDPTATSAHKGLEETRRQIEEQMQR